MLRLYHSPQTRSSRMVWLLEEIGAPYEIEYLDIRAEGGAPESYRTIHPLKKVPALDHDGEIVTESAAICLYLSDAFPAAGLGPRAGEAGRGTYLSWLAYYAGVVEPALMVKAVGGHRLQPAERRLGRPGPDDQAAGGYPGRRPVRAGRAVHHGGRADRQHLPVGGQAAAEDRTGGGLQGAADVAAGLPAELGKGRCLMAEPINLNQARKAREKAAKTAKAGENRAKFGRTPLQRALDAAEAEVRSRKLDASKREDR